MSNTNPIPQDLSILIADDQLGWIAEWKEEIKNHLPDAKTMETTELQEAINLAKQERPGLIILDDNFPGNKYGSPAAREIWKDFPDARIVIASGSGSTALLTFLHDSAPPSAAFGFVFKENIGKLAKVLFERLLIGDCWYDPKLLKVIDWPTHNPVLNDQEYETLVCLALGLSDAGISEVLHITVGSLQVRVNSICQKLGIKYGPRFISSIDLSRRTCYVAMQRGILTCADLDQHSATVTSLSYGVELRCRAPGVVN